MAILSLDSREAMGGHPRFRREGQGMAILSLLLERQRLAIPFLPRSFYALVSFEGSPLPPLRETKGGILCRLEKHMVAVLSRLLMGKRVAIIVLDSRDARGGHPRSSSSFL